MLQAERVMKWVATHDYFAGNFMWTGVDYLGESQWPYKGFASGMIDIVGRPKDSFYLYQSQWTTRHVLHLLPHWNWPGRNGQLIPVVAYSSCNTVELFLNGRSLGEKRLEFPAQGTSGGWNSYALPVVRATTNDLHVTWDVPYEPGVLHAMGKGRDGKVACEDEVRTAGPPAAIRLTAARPTITTSASDVALITFEVVDSSGTVVPTAEDLLQFAVTGASIVAVDNADLHARDRDQPGRGRAFNGRGLVILRAREPGRIQLTGSAAGLRAGTIAIDVTRGVSPPAIPAAR
jgi:beta-galactosidase